MIRNSRTVLHYSNAYIHSKIHLFYNRRAAEDVGSFLGAFAKLQKATTVFVMSVCVCLSVCLSVRPSAWNSSPAGRIVIKSDNNNRYFT